MGPMHEWALAESVIETVRQEVSNRSAVSVDKVTVLFGELQNIDRELFLEGLGQFLTPDLPVGKEAFVVETEGASFVCNKCGHEWDLQEIESLTEDELEAIHFLPESAHVYISCPSCGSSDFGITRGRGVSIKEIEMTEEKQAEGK